MSNAGVDTSPIVADIGRARADMGVAVEALADRVSPQKLKARVKEKLTAKIADVKERINPVRIIQRKLGHSAPAADRGRGVLIVRSGERERLPALKEPARR